MQAVAPLPYRFAAEPLELVERTLSPALARSASRLCAEPFQDVCVRLAAEDLAQALRAPPGLAVQPLLDDAAMLAHLFLLRTGAAELELRLERVTGDACRAFHRDNVRLRLVTTYVGPGTDYVADADAEAALRLQAGFAGEVRRCPACALAWMRGSACAKGAGLAHRSPPIAGTGAVRLVLVLSEPGRASPSRWSPPQGAVLDAAFG
ncbi:MAG: DUF1826 domain-containing protein [Caulobacteraceae bacterium]|nr:DUF1826 domain-containing protein [Caulobacter sp.]